MTSIVKFTISEFSSQSEKYPAKNLLEDDTNSWKCHRWQEWSWITLQVEKEISIESIEFTNNGSAFVEVFTSRSADSNFQVLIPVLSTLSPANSKTLTDCKKRFHRSAKHFTQAKSEPCKLIKFVCSQPFNKSAKYGLVSVKIHGQDYCPVRNGDTNINNPLGRFKYIEMKKTKKDDTNCFNYDLKKKMSLVKGSEEKPKKIRPVVESDPSVEGTSNRDRDETKKRKERNVTPENDHHHHRHQDSDRKKERKEKKDKTSEDRGTKRSSEAIEGDSPSSKRHHKDEKKEKKKKEKHKTSSHMTNGDEIKDQSSKDHHRKDSDEKTKEKKPKLYEEDRTKKIKRSSEATNGDHKETSDQHHRKDSSEKTKEKKVKTPEKEDQSKKIKQSNESTNGDDCRPSTSSMINHDDDNHRRESGEKIKEKKKEKSGSVEGLMSHVVYVLSGYENPLRSELREKATAMGAHYESKWNSNCTHLICAFTNTPKYREVKQQNGRIVSEKWIEDSYSRRRLLEWRNYIVGTYSGPDTPPKANPNRPQNQPDNGANNHDSDVIYDLDTEDESD